MLASTEKRLGIIAASALTAASLLMMSQQHPLTTYKVAEIVSPMPAVQTLADATSADIQKLVVDFSDKQHSAQRLAMR
ncbi:hypothetical protein ACI0FM_09985 [Paenochrobactrum sp. BZR 588]|uniref:hypothetical protein n=1 Tax=unclassified Paenochrobactrum TaxID=2639760 RepID=UPI0038551EE1